MVFTFLPEPYVVFASIPLPESFLNDSGILVVFPLTHLLQQKQLHTTQGFYMITITWGKIHETLHTLAKTWLGFHLNLEYLLCSHKIEIKSDLIYHKVLNLSKTKINLRFEKKVRFETQDLL